jgi:transcription termination factor NusB
MFNSKKFTLNLIETPIIKMTMVEGIELDQNDAKEAISEAVRLAEGKKIQCYLMPM